MRSRVLPLLAALAAAAALVAVPATSARGSASPTDGALNVATLGASEGSLVAMSVSAARAIARVVVTAPAGYDLTLEPGRSIGFVSGILADTGGGSSAFVDGALVSVDPATQVGTPESEACAPGLHAAVWKTTLSVLGQQFPLSIYVDRAPASDPAASFVLRFCPVWASPAVPSGIAARMLSFFLEDSVTRPSATGRYTWSGLVSPVSSGLTPDEPATFEVRAVELIPNRLTLSHRHDSKRRTVTLSGTLSAAGRPVAGAEVSFAASTGGLSETAFFGPVRTDAAGRFSISRPVTVSTRFSAEAERQSVPCTGPSPAPAGCAQETVAPPPPASVLVKVRLATDPRLVSRPRDQAAARRGSFTIRDFPAGWEAYESFSAFECRGFRPKLGSLIATADVESPVFIGDDGAAASRTTVYASEQQARTAFARVATIGMSRCQANELRAEGIGILQLGPVRFAKLGDETRAFRLVYDVSEIVVTQDLVTFRKGRAVVQLVFASIAQPLPEAEALARTLAGRVRA